VIPAIETGGRCRVGSLTNEQLGCLRVMLPSRYRAILGFLRTVESPGEVVLTGLDAGSLRTANLSESLRKEVIQPQVPLRLPCYDLVPVTELAVGTPELGRLRALPAPMT
jgi:hypothetical protein